MSVHIGKIIHASVKKKGMSITSFADEINYSRRNVYEIFEKETIDTGVLLRISKILGENLFLHYITEEELMEQKTSRTLIEELRELIEELKKDPKNSE